jgi:predicted DNA-binding mobile mystery protein A
MNSKQRTIARQTLDNKLIQLRKLLPAPAPGWIKAIREALGMTSSQLGKRLGTSQSAIIHLEKSEQVKSITLDKLEGAAKALHCQLVYSLIPEKPLEEIITERATGLAKQQLASAKHTMALEGQTPRKDDQKEQLKHLIEELIAQGRSELWHENDE